MLILFLGLSIFICSGYASDNMCPFSSLAISKKIFLALDVPDAASAYSLIDELHPLLGGFKIGLELFLTAGHAVAEYVLKKEAKLFIDLKLHDIPRTVHAATENLAKMGAHFITVHALGGKEMMQRAQEAIEPFPNTKILAVTILTSHQQETLREIGLQDTHPASAALSLGKLAAHAGISGLVCSPLEIASLKENLPANFIFVCPGIRQATGREKSPKEDQKRTTSAREAIHNGADYLVMGRPILETANKIDFLHQLNLT